MTSCLKPCQSAWEILVRRRPSRTAGEHRINGQHSTAQHSGLRAHGMTPCSGHMLLLSCHTLMWATRQDSLWTCDKRQAPTAMLYCPSLPPFYQARPEVDYNDEQGSTRLAAIAPTLASRSLPSLERGRTREACRTKKTSTRHAMRSVRADTNEGTCGEGAGWNCNK